MGLDNTGLEPTDWYPTAVYAVNLREHRSASEGEP
jgi:hypothetical protein